MSATTLDIWLSRWKHLEAHLESLKICYQDRSSRSETFQNVIDRLQAFSKGYFSYFYNGFCPESSYSFEQRKAFPQEFVLAAILEQVAYDLELIERAESQRRQPLCDFFGPGKDFDPDFLAHADRLAMKALEPALGAMFTEKPIVITYFQKNTAVRIIPYAPVAFIGLPYTCLTVKEDLLSIPHEVGHYVFRNGSRLNGKNESIERYLNAKVQGYPFYIRNWIEEIFSDFYGAMVGGPVMALDFQDLQLASTFNEFRRNQEDLEDPVPLLRPDIYTKSLHLLAANKPKDSLAQEWQRLADLLHTSWSERRRDRAGLFLEPVRTADEDLTFTTVNSTVSLGDTMSLKVDVTGSSKPLDKVIQIIFEDVLQEVWGNTAVSNWSGSAANLREINTNNLRHLYHKARFSPGQDPGELTKSLTRTEQSDVIGYGPGVTRFWYDWVVAEGFFAAKNGENPAPPSTGEIKKEQWVPLLRANGWVTRGPKGNPVSG